MAKLTEILKEIIGYLFVFTFVIPIVPFVILSAR